VGRLDRSYDRLAALEQSMATPWRFWLTIAGTTLSITALSASLLWVFL